MKEGEGKWRRLKGRPNPSHCGCFLISVIYGHGESTQIYSSLLYFTSLYSIILYSTPLYSTLLYSILLYSTLLYSTVLYSTPLFSLLLPFSELPSTDIYSTVLWALSTQYPLLHCTLHRPIPRTMWAIPVSDWLQGGQYSCLWLATWWSVFLSLIGYMGVREQHAQVKHKT